MKYEFKCEDTGLSCPAQFSNESEAQLLADLDEHYLKAHLGAKPMEYRLKRLIKAS